MPYLNLATADLCALKLLDREEGAKLSLSALCNLSLSNKGYINGNAALNEITFSNAEGKHPIGNILISSNQGPELCTTKVDSDFAELLFSGNSTIEQFVEDIINASPDKDIERFHSHSKSNGNGTAAGGKLHLHQAHPAGGRQPGDRRDHGQHHRAGCPRHGHRDL